MNTDTYRNQHIFTEQNNQANQLKRLLDEYEYKYMYDLRQTTFWSTMRATPVIWNVHNIINMFSDPTPHHIYITGMYLATFYSNDIFKTISKKIYNWWGNNNIPLLGRGSRPEGAENAGYFLKVNRPRAITFGMPSGHAQKTAFMTTYLSIKLWESEFSNVSKIIGSSCLTVLAGYVGISRVHVEKCHTINQVYVGYLLGATMGLVTYEFEPEIISGVSSCLNTLKSHTSTTFSNYICPMLGYIIQSIH